MVARIVPFFFQLWWRVKVVSKHFLLYEHIEPNIQHWFDQFNKLGKSCQKAEKNALRPDQHKNPVVKKIVQELYRWRKKKKAASKDVLK